MNPDRRRIFSWIAAAVLLLAGGGISAEEEEGWGENPFLGDRAGRAASAPAALPASAEGYVLNGILWDAQAPSAVVNGRLVTVGDVLDGWEVTEIRKDRVILSNGSVTRTLK